MARRLPCRAALAVLAPSALALVVACSPGAPSSGEAMKAPGAGTERQPPSTVSAPPGRVTLGPYTQVFATAMPADPAQAAVIADFRTATILWDQSGEELAMVPPVRSYVTGSAVSNLERFLSAEAEEHFVLVGTDTLFRTRATISGDTDAAVTTCDDSSKATTRDTRTGAVASMPPLSKQYAISTWGMTRIAGHWAISSVQVATLPAAAARTCQPAAAR